MIWQSLNAGGTMTAWKVHKYWVIRAALVLVLTVLVDGVVVWFAKRPLLWATLIPATLPLSMLIFVAIPVLRKEGQRSADTASS
jgi:hypothetical protein